jgi:purine nucleoside permease
VNSDLAYEIDAREIPGDWPTGYAPMRRSTPYEAPGGPDSDGEIFALNPQLVAGAFQLTKDVPLVDSDRIRAARAHFVGFPNAVRPLFLTHGDALSGMTFWHGALMDQWTNAWAKYFTVGQANFMVTAMEDTGRFKRLPF